MAKAAKEPDGPLAFILAGGRTAPVDEAAKSKWPTLCQCLMPVWFDGKCKRQAGSLRIRLVGGYYLVTLSAPTEGMESTVTLESLMDLFDAVEAKLSDPANVWVPDWETTKKARQVRIDRIRSE